jgi:HK97 family phage prohead protease
MLHKSYRASYKSGDAATGEVTAIVSVFDNVDLMGDRVVKGAFLDTLESWRKSGDKIPMIWSHSWENPMNHIGGWDPDKAEEVEATDDHPAGLKLVGNADVNDGNPVADQVFKLMKSRRVREFSFAYEVIDEAKADDGSTELKALAIIEAGPTLKGANQETTLLAAKAMGKAEAIAEADDFKAMNERLDSLDARVSALEEPAEEEKAVPPEKRGADIHSYLRLLEI